MKNAIQRDGLDPSIMDLDPEKSIASQLNIEEEPVDDGPPLKEDPTYVKVNAGVNICFLMKVTWLIFFISTGTIH